MKDRTSSGRKRLRSGFRGQRLWPACSRDSRRFFDPSRPRLTRAPLAPGLGAWFMKKSAPWGRFASGGPHTQAFKKGRTACEIGTLCQSTPPLFCVNHTMNRTWANSNARARSIHKATPIAAARPDGRQQAGRALGLGGSDPHQIATTSAPDRHHIRTRSPLDTRVMPATPARVRAFGRLRGSRPPQALRRHGERESALPGRPRTLDDDARTGFAVTAYLTARHTPTADNERPQSAPVPGATTIRRQAKPTHRVLV
jgi:hypothetical protein